MSGMQVVYVPEVPAETFSKSIFLAGPSPRGAEDLDWRPEALKVLEDLGYDGVVFVPLPRGGDWRHHYDAQVEWELTYLNMADVIAFWVPRSKELPGLTTNVEFGMFYDSGKAMLGYPENATQMRYLAHQGRVEHIPLCASLKETLLTAVERIGEGSERTGGERMVPLHIWQLPNFQDWLTAQKGAGNRLDGAKLLWSFRVGPTKNITFAYALHVDIHVAAEGRNETNEFIIGRPDISTMVVYRKSDNLMDTDIVLIREFCGMACTSDGFICEVPPGSWSPGFHVHPSRLRKVGVRQVASTLSIRQAHVFAFKVTEEELVNLRKQKDGRNVEVHRLGDLLDPSSNAVDWSMIGMILTAVT